PFPPISLIGVFKSRSPSDLTKTSSVSYPSSCSASDTRPACQVASSLSRVPMRIFDRSFIYRLVFKFKHIIYYLRYLFRFMMASQMFNRVSGYFIDDTAGLFFNFFLVSFSNLIFKKIIFIFSDVIKFLSKRFNRRDYHLFAEPLLIFYALLLNDCF